MLRVEGLRARVDGQEILRGVDLEVGVGEVAAIMGPNGSGKSTLAHVLAGREGYEITGGTVSYDGMDLLAMPPEERASAGVFLAFQYPTEIPGVGNLYFLHTALSSIRRRRGLDEVDASTFLRLAQERMALLQMDPAFMSRSVNEGFSGGERKRNEILQMAILEPRLAILDETDSGLDIDALRVVAGGVNALRSPERAILVITHHQRLLEHIVPDRVHVMADGRIVRSGERDLAVELEAHGYGDLHRAGHPPTRIDTTARVGIEEADEGSRGPATRFETESGLTAQLRP